MTLAFLHEFGAHQRYVERLTSAIWQDESIEQAALALGEECGEVARAILKRDHALKGLGDRDPCDWDAQLRKELSQIGIVIMKMAEREGFNLWGAIAEEIIDLDKRYAAIEAAKGNPHGRMR